MSEIPQSKLIYSKDIVNTNNEDVRDLMMLFLQEFIVTGDSGEKKSFSTIASKLSGGSDDPVFDFRISIDFLGNSPLHWLSKLSFVDVIGDVFASKSDKILSSEFIVNENSETCLVECIKSINSFNSDNFNEMLTLFENILFSVDLINERSILHHICFNYNEKASEYYLTTVLKHISTNYSSDVFHTFINKKDINGDTCLNIASKLNIYSLVEILVENSADPSIENFNHIKPADYGVKSERLSNKLIFGESEGLTTPISLINDTISEINTTYMKETASYTDTISSLKEEIEKKEKELSSLKSQVNKVDMKDYESLSSFSFLNNGLLKQTEMLDRQLDSFPEFKNFMPVLESNQGKLPVPLVSDELLNIVEDSLTLVSDSESSESKSNQILLQLKQKNLLKELDDITVEQLDTLIETYKQQNESMISLYKELGEHKKRRLTKYRTLIAKTLDMSPDDVEEIDMLVEGMCADL